MRRLIHRFFSVLMLALWIAYVLLGCCILLGITLNFSRAAWPTSLWLVLGFCAFATGYFYGIPGLVHYGSDVWRRRVFRTVSCPACNTSYDRLAIRRSKHLLRTKVHGGPPPEAFMAEFYEVWELACTSCGYKQDFGASGKTIPADGPALTDATASDEEA
jgi:hypothetical protein